MTTATTYDNAQSTITAEETSRDAWPVDFGAGFAQPEKAMRPGLVYDMESKDYLRFFCGLGYNSIQMQLFDRGFYCSSNPPMRVEDANLPSFVTHFPDASDLFYIDTGISFHRTRSNVGRAGCENRASVDVQPRGFHISIDPPSLIFPTSTAKKSFVLRVTPQGATSLPKIHLSGMLISSGIISWTDGTHVVRSPVVVMVGPVSGL